MGFDMRTPTRGAGIAHHEEFIFSLVERDPKKYPELHRIWREFYNDPPITADQAERLVGELMDLLDKHQQEKAIVNVLVRLLPFFYFAYKEKTDIRTLSD